MTRVVLLLALMAGCTVERQVLGTTDAQVLTSCDVAWDAPLRTACDFSDRCHRPSPADPLCCIELSYCVDGWLSRFNDCVPECRPCNFDQDCEPGKSYCAGDRCTGCAPADTCRACVSPLVPLERNGCPGCECAPPSQCNTDEDCGSGICYPGATCAAGCSDRTCCSNVCGPAEPPCPTPAPAGCFARCPVELNCEGECTATACVCVDGRWDCRVECIAPQLAEACLYLP